MTLRWCSTGVGHMRCAVVLVGVAPTSNLEGEVACNVEGGWWGRCDDDGGGGCLMTNNDGGGGGV